MNLGDLEGEREALAGYLQSKLGSSVTINDKLLLLDDSKAPIRSKDVKMYIEQFIYHRKFPGEYRIIVEHPIIKVLKPKPQVKPKPRTKGMWG